MKNVTVLKLIISPLMALYISAASVSDVLAAPVGSKSSTIKSGGYTSPPANTMDKVRGGDDPYETRGGGFQSKEPPNAKEGWKKINEAAKKANKNRKNGMEANKEALKNAAPRTKAMLEQLKKAQAEIRDRELTPEEKGKLQKATCANMRKGLGEMRHDKTFEKIAKKSNLPAGLISSMLSSGYIKKCGPSR